MSWRPVRAGRDAALAIRGIEHHLLRWGPDSGDPVLLLHGHADCAATFQFLADELPVEVGHRAEHGEVLTFGDCSVSLVHLRGHTPGSLAVVYDAAGRLADSPHVFTGDSLFPGGVGRTNSPEDFTSLLTDVSERLFGQLPDATWVYPGHGNDTTLGTERPHLGEWRERGW